MAAPYAGESLASPGFYRTHHAKDFLSFCLHPIGKLVFVLAHVVGDADNRHSKPAFVSIDRVKIEKIACIRKSVRLNPNHAVMLPVAKMVFVRFTPTADIRRQRFPANLDRQKLLFGTEGRASNKSVLHRVELGGEKVVDDDTLGCGTGVAIEYHIREVPVHVREHFGHETLTKLAGVIAETALVTRVPGEEHEAQALECIRTKNDDPTALNTTRSVQIDVFDAAHASVSVSQNSDNAAMSA